MRSWIHEQWKDVASSVNWLGRRTHPKPLRSKSATVDASPKRMVEVAGRLQRELTAFVRANGSMPEVASTEDFGALWSWQHHMNGWYEGKIKPAILPLLNELAERGLTDSVLDDTIHQTDQTEENIVLIAERLRVLASRR